MTDRTSLSLLKRTIPSCSFPENIVLGDIIQNLFNLRVNYPRRFLHVSILLISDCTLRLLKKLVKRKLQEEVLFFQIPPTQKTILRLTPTNVCRAWFVKVRITV
jgi:hypothetical protein